MSWGRWEPLGTFLGVLGGVFELLPAAGRHFLGLLGRLCALPAARRRSQRLLAARRRFSASAEILLGRREPTNIKEEDTLLQENYQNPKDHPAGKLPNVDTQLGAFGPSADPTRSKAAYPTPRLRAYTIDL